MFKKPVWDGFSIILQEQLSEDRYIVVLKG